MVWFIRLVPKHRPQPGQSSAWLPKICCRITGSTSRRDWNWLEQFPWKNMLLRKVPLLFLSVRLMLIPGPPAYPAILPRKVHCWARPVLWQRNWQGAISGSIPFLRDMFRERVWPRPVLYRWHRISGNGSLITIRWVWERQIILLCRSGFCCPMLPPGLRGQIWS